MGKNLLLISNSTNYGEEYLSWPREHIKEYCNDKGVKKVLFVPYAGVGIDEESLEKSFDAYETKVGKVFSELGLELYSIHKEKDPVEAVKNAECIAVGGGNTFHLVYMMHKLGVMKAVRESIEAGVAYMGWSAGSNVACPSLKTTNDMPIIEPASFECLNVVPFQINPHYLDADPEGHGGETREQRIEEFLLVNRDMYVAGLREGCLLRVDDGKMKMVGERNLRLFKHGQDPKEIP
ncbi:MAG: dipeptidase PepE, partial [Bacteroidota bacterium]|nr:dipeptidase PepE [Bacteroidota bacterium]